MRVKPDIETQLIIFIFTFNNINCVNEEGTTLLNKVAFILKCAPMYCFNGKYLKNAFNVNGTKLFNISQFIHLITSNK